MKNTTAADPIDRNRFPVEPWSLRETIYNAADLGLTEALFAVGNGSLGLRGNVEEGRSAFAHGTFINGFHEIWPIHHAEEAYGFAKVGQTIINAPDAKIILFTAHADIQARAADQPEIDAFLLKTDTGELLPLAQQLTNMLSLL